MQRHAEESLWAVLAACSSAAYPLTSHEAVSTGGWPSGCIQLEALKDGDHAIVYVSLDAPAAQSISLGPTNAFTYCLGAIDRD